MLIVVMVDAAQAAVQVAGQVGVQVGDVLAAAPAPPPGGGGGFDWGGGGVQAPPGSEQLYTILGYARWGALIAAVASLFIGLVVFTVGRVADNRRGSTTGTMMILASMGAALLFGIGPLLLQSFAGQ